MSLTQTLMSVRSMALVHRPVKTPKVATTASVHPDTGKWGTATNARLKVRNRFPL